jgi:receptor protein-tyrosine kinase
MTLIEKALARKNALKQTKKSSQTTPINEDTNIQNSVSNADIVGQEQVKAEAKFNATIDNTDHLIIDLESLAKRGYLVETGERLCITEEFRQIKRKLLGNAFGLGAKTLNNGNLIMVTSAKPNEGKTFIATNLALSIAAEKNKTVLLVDSDVLMPSLNRELGIAETQGLIDYLHSDDLDVSNIIYNTNIDKLKIISAGKKHHLSNELLASEKMATLANELATRYPDRIVIFDSPPLVGISETQVLAQLMGQALLVVEESKTRIADIQKATENLHEDLALGLVLNKAIRSHKDLYGYYGYGYGDN